MGAFSINSSLFPHPPEATNYVDQYSHLAQLRQMLGMAPLQRQQAQQQIQAGQLDIQQKQQALNDTQAATKAMQEWDGQNFMELPGLVLKHGGSAQAVFGLKNQILQQQEAMTKLSADQHADQKQVNDIIAGHIANVQALPPEQQADGFQSAVQDLVAKKYVSPQEAQGMKYQGPQQLDYLKKTYQGLSAMQEEALKKGQTQEAVGKGAEAQATANEKNQQGQFFNKMGLPAGITPDMAGYAAYIQKGGQPEGYQAWKAQQEAAAKMPYEIKGAVAKSIAEAQALAPDLKEVVRTTGAGRQYLSAEDAVGKAGSLLRQQAAQAGIPVVNKDVASTLEDIDTAKKNQDYMLNLIGKKLASGAASRLWYGPANTLEKIGQTDPEMASVGTFRNAAIQSMRAVAGSKGLRINQAEIQMAIDNDIPKLTDTLPVAQQKLTNLKTFLDNAESSHLTRDRSAGAGQGGPTLQSHNFSLGAWQRANPGGNTSAAKAAAIQQGYNVVP